MNFTNVIIHNFLTIGHAEINLKERGLLLIQGNNKDDSSADSNGAGKSSIADAICWALFGVTARGVSTDAVVNKTAKKDCYVELYLEDAGEEYCIVRHRKDSANKNATFVKQKSAIPGALPTDLHKGTEKETQEVINAIVGCSLEVFQAAVYAGQEKMPDLPAMTDKQLKLMIEEAAGVEVLSKAHSIARERLNAAKSTYAVAERESMTLGSQYASVVDSILEEEKKHTEYESNRKPLAKMELAKIPELQKKDAALEAQIAAEEALDRSKESVEIVTKFAALKHERDELENLEKIANAAERSLSGVEARARIAKSAHTDAVEALRTVDDKVGTPCGECGKEYCAHDVEAVKRLREEDIAACATNLREVVEEYKLLKAQSKLARDTATHYKSTMTDVSAMAARQKVLQDELREIELLKGQREGIARNIATYKKSAKDILEAVNPFTSTVALLKKQSTELTAKVAKINDVMKEQEEQVELLEDLSLIHI